MRRQWHEYTVQVGEGILTFQQIRFSEVNMTETSEQPTPHRQHRGSKGNLNTQHKVWVLVDEIFADKTPHTEVQEWITSPSVEQIILVSSCKRSEIACLIRTAIQTRNVFDQFATQRRKNYRTLEEAKQHLLSAIGTILLP